MSSAIAAYPSASSAVRTLVKMTATYGSAGEAANGDDPTGSGAAGWGAAGKAGAVPVSGSVMTVTLP
jgi:hypothetical protein